MIKHLPRKGWNLTNPQWKEEPTSGLPEGLEPYNPTMEKVSVLQRPDTTTTVVVIVPVLPKDQTGCLYINS